MEKYIKLLVQKGVDSGTTDGAPSGANDLIDAGQNFETTVSVGDIVHNTADNTWHIVEAVVDAENLTLVSGTVPTGKTYVIYSATSTYEQRIPAKGAPFVKAASSSSTTVTYTGTGSTGSDVITITHYADSSYDSVTNPVTTVKTKLEDLFIEAARTHYTKSDIAFSNPAGIYVTAVTIG